MGRAVSRRTVLGLLLEAPLLLAGCSAVASDSRSSATSSAAVDAPTPAVKVGEALSPASTEAPPATATATPAATATGTAVLPPPATPTPQPAVSAQAIDLIPASIPQGGVTTVVLNLPATSATVTFQGRQYQMLAKGDRHWAVIGTGGFTDPGSYTVSISYVPAAGGPATTATTKLPITNAGFEVESVTLDAQTATLLAPDIVNNELSQRAAIYSGYTMEKLWSGPFLRPSTAAIGDTYGLARSYNGAPATDYHRGTDFTGFTGEPAKAAAPAPPSSWAPSRSGATRVILDHGAGVFTAYHHLSRFDVSQGATSAPASRSASSAPPVSSPAPTSTGRSSSAASRSMASSGLTAPLTAFTFGCRPIFAWHCPTTT